MGVDRESTDFNSRDYLDNIPEDYLVPLEDNDLGGFWLYTHSN